MRGVRGREQTPDPLLAERTFVLAHCRRRAVGAIHAITGGVVDLDRAERGVAFGARRPQRERARRAELAEGLLEFEPALGDAELVVRAAGDREVALMWIERTFDHAQRLDDLRDDEVRVRVPVAVRVVDLVDRNTLDGELDVLALLGVEAAQEHLIGVARATLVREKQARRLFEHLAGACLRGLRQLRRRDLDRACTAIELRGRLADRARHRDHLAGRRHRIEVHGHGDVARDGLPVLVRRLERPTEHISGREIIELRLRRGDHTRVARRAGAVDLDVHLHVGDTLLSLRNIGIDRWLLHEDPRRLFGRRLRSRRRVGRRIGDTRVGRRIGHTRIGRLRPSGTRKSNDDEHGYGGVCEWTDHGDSSSPCVDA